MERLERGFLDSYTDEATWVQQEKARYTRCGMPEYQQAGEGDPALVLPIYTRFGRGGVGAQAFKLLRRQWRP